MKHPIKGKAPWWGLACCKSYGKRIAGAPNKARERWNNMGGEINNDPTTGNGVGASSLEIRTGNLSVGYPVDFKSSGAKPNTAEGRLPCLVAVLSDVTARPLTFSVRSRGISHSKWRWFLNVQLTVFSDLFAKINALQPNLITSESYCFFFWNISTDLYMLFWSDLERFCTPKLPF